MRNRLFLTLLSLYGSAIAQTISTSSDGGVVLLESPWKLHSATLRGSSVYESRDSGLTWRSLASPGPASDAVTPFVTGDGSISMWQRAGRCMGSCMIALPNSYAEFANLDTARVRIPTYLSRLSPNGQFLVTPGFYGFMEYQMQDLHSGTVYSPENGSPRLVVLSAPADDGTVLAFLADRTAGLTQAVLPRALVAWKPGLSDPRLVRTNFDPVYTAAITADATRAAVWTASALQVIDLASGAMQQITTADAPYGYLVSLANDGRSLIHSNGSGRLSYWQVGEASRLLSSVPDNVSAATLSGDGKLAFVLTVAGALLRVNLPEDRAQTVLPPVPTAFNAMTFGHVPGSAALFRTWNATQPPGLLVETGGTQLPQFDSGEASTVAVQIPWDFQAPRDGASFPLTVRREGSPFFLETDLWVTGRVQPSFANQTETYIKAAKADFRSLVTPDTPALPGETIHTYLFGLGPLDRDVPTGVRGPTDPPAHPTAPVACYIAGLDQNPPARGLALPFVAYAPGLIGVYQIDMTIPDDWPAGDAILTCQSEPPQGAYGRIPVGRL